MSTPPASSVRLICPNLKCRTLLSVPISARGKAVRCRQCGMKVQVPGNSPQPAPATTPSA